MQSNKIQIKNNAGIINLTKAINQLSVSLFSVFLVFFLVWLFLLSFGKYDGAELFHVFFYNSFVNSGRLKKILLVFAPFLLGSTAVWICFKVGIINLGISGQMSITALSVYFVAYFLKKAGHFTSDLATLQWLPLFLLVGIVSALLVSCFCGSLKIYFGINEIVSAIFINYIIFYLFRYLVTLETVVNSTKLATKEPLGPAIGFNVAFGLFSVGFVLSLIIFFVVFFVFHQTKFGFQMFLIGKNKAAANYGGLNIAHKTMVVFAISGILAGLAGLFYYYRDPTSTYLYKSEALPNNGFDTITIVWLSQGSLLALPLTSFFVALLRVQQRVIKFSAVNPVIVDMMIGLIILFIAFFTKLFSDQSFYLKIQGLFQKLTPSTFKLKINSLVFKKQKLVSKKENKLNFHFKNNQNLRKVSYLQEEKIKKKK